MGQLFLGKNNDLLENYHTDYIIIDKFYPLYEKLKQAPEYFLAYESKHFALYLPKKLKGQKFLLPTKDKNYYNNEKFVTSIGWE